MGQWNIGQERTFAMIVHQLTTIAVQLTRIADALSKTEEDTDAKD